MNKVLVSLVFCACCSIICSNGNKQELDMAARCMNILMSTEVQPARGNDTLRVVVPWKTGYPEFVKFDPKTCMIDGFSVQVFLQALRHMERNRSSLRYQFVLHGTGDETPPFDEMLDMLVNEEVDIVVADLTITRDRADRVAFTFPYLPSSLVMVTPFSYGSAGTIWDFAKPFSLGLWGVLLVCFLVTGFVLYRLEDQNPDFSITSKKSNRDNSSHGSGSSKGSQSILQYSPRDGVQQGDPHIPASHDVSNNTTDELSPVMLPGYNPHQIVAPTNYSNVVSLNDASSIQPLGASIYDQASHARRFTRFTNAYWFTSMCIFQTQHESVRTHPGRIVTVSWLFLMLIFNSSYIASLASLLSSKKPYPTIQSFETLIRDTRIPIGYQSGSFMRTYMQKIQISGNQILNFSSANDVAQALRKGPDRPGGVGAMIDELPYMQILLQSQCDLTIASTSADHLPTFGGLGFALRKGDPLTDEISKMILELREDGTLKVLENGWNIGDGNKNKCNQNDETPALGLRSFGGLFSILAAVYLICFALPALSKIIKSRATGRIHICQGVPCLSQNAFLRTSSNKVYDEHEANNAVKSSSEPSFPMRGNLAQTEECLC